MSIEMHYEILVEDQSGKVALEAIVPKIISDGSTFSIHPYKGIGHIPRGMKTTIDASKRVLLNHLPRLLSGYGKAFASYPSGYQACVVIVCDLDHRNLKEFLKELDEILESCNPKPVVRFCMSIEEGEAWLLGQKTAVKKAFPKAKQLVLDRYVYDSVCGTWEILANAVYDGGAEALLAKGKPEVGRLKSIWARKIAPLINIEENESPSFQFFVKTLRDLSDET